MSGVLSFFQRKARVKPPVVLPDPTAVLPSPLDPLTSVFVPSLRGPILVIIGGDPSSR